MNIGIGQLLLLLLVFFLLFGNLNNVFHNLSLLILKLKDLLNNNEKNNK